MEDLQAVRHPQQQGLELGVQGVQVVVAGLQQLLADHIQLAQVLQVKVIVEEQGMMELV
jgi:hypothetical protein